MRESPPPTQCLQEAKAHQPQSTAGQVVVARGVCLALAKEWVRNSSCLKIIKPDRVINLSVFLHEKKTTHFTVGNTPSNLART